MYFSRRLTGNEKEWIFFKGETRVIYDSTPPDSVPMNIITEKHLDDMKVWKIENESILDYRIVLTPTLQNLEFGSNDYEHVFTGKKPGNTFAICHTTKRKIPVTVHGVSTFFSCLGPFIPTIRKIMLLR